MSRLCRQQKGENMGNATIIAVDTGNKLMKTQNFVFSAGVKDHMGRMPATLEDIEVLQYQKHFYTVSEQHIPNIANKTEDARYTVLTLFGVAKELNLNGTEQYRGADGVVRTSIILALGLPISHYEKYKGEYTRFYRNGGVPFVFSYKPQGGKMTKYEITVDRVYVFPQGFAACQSSPEVRRICRDGTTYVVDIGGYTTDIVRLRDGRPDPDFAKTFNRKGFNDLAAKINDRVQDMVGEALLDYQIDRILSEDGAREKIPQRVTALVQETARTYGRDFLTSILENSDMNIALATVVFVGGGSLRLRPYITEAIKARGGAGAVKWIPELKANAIGYYALTAAMEKRRK